MEKLTTKIDQFKISPETKAGLLEMSIKRRRKLTEFIRINLDIIVKKYKEGEWIFKDEY